MSDHNAEMSSAWMDINWANSVKIDAQAAEIARLRAFCNEQSRALDLSGMRHGRILVGLERRNARQRRALAKMYQRRHHRNALINHLIAALATARRDAMEELERHFREAAAGTPLGHEDHQRGASTYNWLIYCATTISAIKDRAAAGEVKP